MPAAIPAILGIAGSLAASAFSTGAFALATGAIWITLGKAALVGAISGLSILASGSSKSSDSASAIQRQSQGISRQFRQAKAPRQIVYGEVRKSGSIAYVKSTDSNKYLHMVIRLASHEIEGIEEYIVNEVSITPDMLDANGNLTSGKYAGLIRLRPHLGADDQLADALLVSEVTEWTNNHRLRGTAYLYVRIEWDAEIWLSGYPSISCWLRGAKILDTRDDVVRWSPNIALITRAYLTHPMTVLQTDPYDIDLYELNASANICDEIVGTQLYQTTITAIDTITGIITLTPDNDRLYYQRGDRVNVRSSSSFPDGIEQDQDYYIIPVQREVTPRVKLASTLQNALAGVSVPITSVGSGTLQIVKNGEPRYHGGGWFEAGKSPREDLESILSGMAGNQTNSGGSWRIMAGAYRTPTLYLDENDIVGGIQVSTKVSRLERFNAVQGSYLSPINGGNEADYPLVTRDAYQDADGQELRCVLDLAVTQRPHTAQRIARIALDRARMDISFQAQFSLQAMNVQSCDNFYFSFAPYGWKDMVFEVQEWTSTTKDGAPVVEMSVRQNNIDVFSWISDYEAPVRPSKRTNMLSPYVVTVVGSFALDSQQVFTAQGDKTFKIIASWQLHEDAFVRSGGKYEIEFKKATDASYSSAGTISGDMTAMEIPQLEPDINYDIRIRAFNVLGVPSAYTEINGFQAGQTVISNDEDWEAETVEGRNLSDFENDDGVSEDWEA